MDNGMDASQDRLDNLGCSLCSRDYAGNNFLQDDSSYIWRVRLFIKNLCKILKCLDWLHI